MLATLENLITAGCKTEDELFPLSLQAAAAVEVGMEALYPSSMVRKQSILYSRYVGFNIYIFFSSNGHSSLRLVWDTELL